jgi:hypothetical protein
MAPFSGAHESAGVQAHAEMVPKPALPAARKIQAQEEGPQQAIRSRIKVLAKKRRSSLARSPPEHPITNVEVSCNEHRKYHNSRMRGLLRNRTFATLGSPPSALSGEGLALRVREGDFRPVLEKEFPCCYTKTAIGKTLLRRLQSSQAPSASRFKSRSKRVHVDPSEDLRVQVLKVRDVARDD